jgi:hypothetical protein
MNNPFFDELLKQQQVLDEVKREDALRNANVPEAESKQIDPYLPFEVNPMQQDDRTNAERMSDNMKSPLMVAPEYLGKLDRDGMSVQQPEVAPVIAEAPTPPIQEQKVQTRDDLNAPSDSAPPQTPMSPSLSPQEKMLAEYKAMQDADRKALEEARSSDRNLKMGGAIGDALATIVNARGQMNVKAPGVQVQQGAGLGKIADMFATAPDIASDLKSKREDLLAQYKQLQTGKDSELQERRVKAYEDQVKASANKPKGVMTDYQKYQQGEQGEKDVRSLKTDIVKSGLPRLTQGIADLEKQLGMPLEEAVARNTDKDSSNDVDVPGFGRVNSLVPDVMAGSEGRDFRQAVQAVLNPDISKQYGATQSAGEIERYGKQIGSGKFERQDTVLKGLASLKRAAQEDLAAIEGAYKPAVLDTYKERGGLTSSSKEEVQTKVHPQTGKTLKKVPGGWEEVD